MTKQSMTKQKQPSGADWQRKSKTTLGFNGEPWKDGVTQKDVAKAVGVSPITVSRALHQPELVKPETAALVRSAADRMGYIPNQLAGGLASLRTNLIVAIVPQMSHSTYIDIIQGLADNLADHDYHVLLGLSGFDMLKEEALVAALLRHRPDGILLTGVDHSPVTRQRLQQRHLPVVEAWDMTSTPIDMLVGFSHEKAGRSVARFLLSKGYRHFGLISARNERGERRLKGIIEELHRQGLTEIPIHTNPVPSSFRAGRAAACALLNRHEIDVLVCSSDVLAQGAMAEAHSRGLAIPSDVAIMGFGDFDFAPHLFPALASVRVSGHAIGSKAADMLISKIKGRLDVPSTFDTRFEIIERDSV